MIQFRKLLLSFWFGIIFLNAYAEERYTSVEEQAEALKTYYEKTISAYYDETISSTKEERSQYEQLFFEAFPSSFQTFKAFYFPRWRGGGGLELGDPGDHFELFYRLRYIDKAAYYNKYINIAIGGGREDYVGRAFVRDLYRKLFYNTEAILAVLSKRSAEDIASFFRFVLAAPAPEEYDYILSYNEFLYSRETYSKLRDRVVKAAPNIAQLPAVKALLDQYAEKDAPPVKSTPVEEQAELITTYYEKALNCTGKERAKYERLFFEVFPSSFVEMQIIYGNDGDFEGVAPLYALEYHIDFFRSLEYVNKKRHYNKYIDICINGVWEGDSIEEGFGIDGKLYYDTKKMTSLLAKRTDAEIKSVFRFLFDGPHPNNELNKKVYNSLYPKIKQANPKVARLMKEAYEQLLSEEHCPGH